MFKFVDFRFLIYIVEKQDKPSQKPLKILLTRLFIYLVILSQYNSLCLITSTQFFMQHVLLTRFFLCHIFVFNV